LWPDPGASIEKRVEVEIYEKTVRTTLSMIIHKIVACSLAFPKLFIISPNARIERRDRATSGRHAYEFTQLDFELRDATSKDVRNLVEGLVSGLITNLRSAARDELARLGRFESLRTPKIPFKVYDRKELEDKFEEDHETQLPMKISDPVWVTNIPREFYDFEDFESGTWDNYDLILPQYGEILSGSRREWEYDKISKKMKRDNVAMQNYEQYLKMAKEGRTRPTAGAGIGLERLVSWLTGAKHVGETQPFPRIPGIVYDL
jgi:asparaginyl-tRNA synthetase